MNSLLEPIDEIGNRAFGDLWRTFYSTIQDAIVLSLLLKIPNLVSTLILGKEFSSFDRCLTENAFGVDRYACFIIVIGDFCLWIVLGGRILIRFVKDFQNLIKGEGSKDE